MATKVSIPALIQALGGKENLAQATHCATRLRVTTRDKSKIDEAALKAIPGVLGVVNNGTQTQIIIGAEVNNVYKDFIAQAGARDYTRIDLTGGVFDILERECHQQISSNVAHLKASCGDDAIRSAMRLAPGEAMLLLDEVCFNRLCRPVMRSLSYYTNFFDFSILRKLL